MITSIVSCQNDLKTQGQRPSRAAASPPHALFLDRPRIDLVVWILISRVIPDAVHRLDAL
jgi:hypothetical protein